MHHIRQDINLALNVCKAFCSLGFQQVHKPQRWKDAVEQMREHTLVIIRLKLALRVFTQLVVATMCPSFRGQNNIAFQHSWHHHVNK